MRVGSDVRGNAPPYPVSRPKRTSNHGIAKCLEVPIGDTSRPSGPWWQWASPRHAQADIALESNARLSAPRRQIAGIAVDADVAGQLAGDATAAFECGAAVPACRDTEAVEVDVIEAIGSPPHVALEIRLPHRPGARAAAKSPTQHPACAPGEHVGAVERDGRDRH